MAPVGAGPQRGMLSDSDALARELLFSAQDALYAAAADLTLALRASTAPEPLDALILVRAVECEAEVTPALERFEERRR